jgi:hypothetical protein
MAAVTGGAMAVVSDVEGGGVVVGGAVLGVVLGTVDEPPLACRTAVVVPCALVVCPHAGVNSPKLAKIPSVSRRMYRVPASIDANGSPDAPSMDHDAEVALGSAEACFASDEVLPAIRWPNISE